MDSINNIPKLTNSDKLVWLSLLHILDVIALEYESPIDHQIHDIEMDKIYKSVQRLITRVGNRDDHDIEEMEALIEKELKNEHRKR